MVGQHAGGCREMGPWQERGAGVVPLETNYVGWGEHFTGFGVGLWFLAPTNTAWG